MAPIAATAPYNVKHPNSGPVSPLDFVNSDEVVEIVPLKVSTVVIIVSFAVTVSVSRSPDMVFVAAIESVVAVSLSDVPVAVICVAVVMPLTQITRAIDDATTVHLVLTDKKLGSEGNCKPAWS